MFDFVKLKLKINSLENENEALTDLLRAQIVDQVIDKFKKIEKYEQVLEENKRLKLKIKKLQEAIKKKGK